MAERAGSNTALLTNGKSAVQHRDVGYSESHHTELIKRVPFWSVIHFESNNNPQRHVVETSNLAGHLLAWRNSGIRKENADRVFNDNTITVSNWRLGENSADTNT